MVKIDLHLHSKFSSINGDTVHFESIASSLYDLKDNNVKIAAFTDHNTFVKSFYEEAKALATKFGILMLPGVEVDVIRENGKIGHIVLIIDDQGDLSKFEELVKTNFGKRKINTNEFFKVIKNGNFIVIPHVGKSDNFDFVDLKNHEVDAIETTNLDNVSFQKYNKESNTRDLAVAFSDTHNWKQNKYPQNSKLFTYVENVKSFTELKATFKNKKVFLGDRYKPFEKA